MAHSGWNDTCRVIATSLSRAQRGDLRGRNLHVANGDWSCNSHLDKPELPTCPMQRLTFGGILA
jgi:hypothetical protein